MYNKEYKKIAKVFIIISMVLKAILIIPLVMGIITLKQIEKKYMTEEDKTLMGILNILFGSTIAGIFILVGKPIKDLSES
ncbi:Uncharacterised protein [Mycoplasma putrefaciens]|uniref:Uncharacterized protein n=1 Tax=Mycoplasma putrefaciens (strain ATCC 15718 / NCTC 10155 / C30 KS-1 / KS-1) TaxID=743965 RepID=A0A7U3ZRX6_MYCPK|nr:hypothetical protein [Mycoplasma putrefaciens]AEM68417.1 hypothetical protein MPUT_0009 [Mycoplasma putrefaciens KS1]SYV94697.1 Uncharacterised protein [Mycoplasma putrefaciens]